MTRALEPSPEKTPDKIPGKKPEKSGEKSGEKPPETTAGQTSVNSTARLVGRPGDRQPARAAPFGARDWTVVALTAFLAWTGVAPNDRVVWILETFWVMIAIALWFLWIRRTDCTRTVFALVMLHAVVLVVGGMYTYTLVPAGAWVQEWMGRPRNDYDRLGHFMQGFAPALVWRETFLRNGVVAVRGWLGVIVVGMCLAFSAFFELLEFGGAVLAGEPGVNFLGAQGDAWDAQWDMLFCGVGALLALALFARVQDREIARRARPATDPA